MRSVHMAAFVAHLNGLAALSGKVHDSDAPLNGDGTIKRASYVVVFDVGPDSLDDDRLAVVQAVDSAGEYRFVTKSVGVDPFAVRQVRDAVAARVTGHRLVVAGRTCGPAYLDPSDAPVQRDTSVSPPLYFIEDDWIVPSDRAA